MEVQNVGRIVGSESSMLSGEYSSEVPHLLIRVIGFADCHLHRDYKFSSRQRLFDATYSVSRNGYDVDYYFFLFSAKYGRVPKLREKESPEMVAGCENTKSFGIDFSTSTR